MRVCGVILSLLLGAPGAFAQAATIAVFTAAATNPNVNVPVAPAVVYATPTCNQPAFTEIPPITNPTDGFYQDPANALRDCAINVTAQMAALPVASGYKGAIKLGTGLYGPFSTSFAVAAQVAHPCDTTPASPTLVNTNQGFTLGWCHPSLDTLGAPTVITSWRVYRNNVLVTAIVTAGATANAAGLKFYTTPRTEAAAIVASFEVAAVSAGGEGARMPALALTVVQPPPPALPVAPSRGRVTVP